MKRKQLNRIILILCVVPFLNFSCKKIPVIKPPQNYCDSDFNQVFEAFWTGMNNNYVFWDIDTTNWNRVHNTYKPLFAQLNIKQDADIWKAYGYFTEMTQGLIDGHYRISFFNKTLSGKIINPSRFRKKNLKPEYTFNFFKDTIANGYFDKGTRRWCNSIFIRKVAEKTDTSYMGIVTGVIHETIVYFHISEFQLKNIMNDDSLCFISVWKSFLQNINKPFCKSLIIDLRSNGGGDITDLSLICGPLIDRNHLITFIKEKSGNGRLDYTPWVQNILSPDSAGFTKPIVILTDQWSASMAEITTMALKTRANTYVVGDTTWGANGLLSPDYEYYGGGEFDFAGFGYVYTPDAQNKCWNGVSYEGKGFPPDVYIPYYSFFVNNGVDRQLEEAIHILPR